MNALAGHEACLGLGSNLGPSAMILRSVLYGLRRHPLLRFAAFSSFYESEPVGMRSRNHFINAAVSVRTSLPPLVLLSAVQNIEYRYGRIRLPEADEGHQDRTLDIDILLYDNKVLTDRDLTIPHPRMLERLFVLEPLAEIAGDHMHPLAGKTIRALLQELKANEPEQRIIKLDLAV